METSIVLQAEESVAIVESLGFMAAARLVQRLGQETRSRVVAVSPVNAAGSITTIIAGPLAEVQHALQMMKAEGLVEESAFFARPNIATMEMLIRSVMGASFGGNITSAAETATPTTSHFQAARSESYPKQTATEHPFETTITRRPVMRKVKSTTDFQTKTLLELEALSVVELRKYARILPDFPIVGRAISRANRAELLQLMKTLEERIRTTEARSSLGQAMLPS